MNGAQHKGNPYEQKRGTPWWVIVLAVIGALGLMLGGCGVCAVGGVSCLGSQIQQEFERAAESMYEVDPN